MVVTIVIISPILSGKTVTELQRCWTRVSKKPPYSMQLVNLVQVELQKDAAADVQPEPEERDVDDFSDELDGNLLNSSFEVQPKRARMADDETS
jgi:hypothetical protein